MASEITQAIQDAAIALQNAKELCNEALHHLKEAKKENDALIQRLETYIRGLEK